MQVSWYFDSSYSRWDLGGGVEVYVAGAAFEGGVLLEGESLARRVADLVGECAVRGGGFALNGFYGACYADGARVVLAVDHVRSRPLFYAERDGVWHVGSAVWDMARALGLGAGDVEEASRIDFLGCGYVCGDRTLLRGLHQLYADASGWLDGGTGRLTLRDNGVLSGECDPVEESALWGFHRCLLDGAVSRLVRYAGGRTIVIPLSAGLDSKLIACELKRVGYPDVQTYSYGRRGNAEAVESERVAGVLGFPWHFVEYTDRSFRRAWRDMLSPSYLRCASGLVSMPHVQDFAAVGSFSARGLFREGSVFVPGHTPVGILLPSDMGVESRYTYDDYVRHGLQKRFGLNSRLRRRHREQLVRSVSVFVEPFAGSVSAREMARMVSYWWRTHGEARYLVNSLYTYRHFGYDSWMPLWDTEYVAFQKSMPFALLLDRVWYRWYVDGEYASMMGAGWGPFVNTYRPRSAGWYRCLRRSGVGQLLLRLRRYADARRHDFCANAIYGGGELFGRIMRGDNVLAKYAEEALEGVLAELSR